MKTSLPAQPTPDLTWLTAFMPIGFPRVVGTRCDEEALKSERDASSKQPPNVNSNEKKKKEKSNSEGVKSELADSERRTHFKEELHWIYSQHEYSTWWNNFVWVNT